MKVSVLIPCHNAELWIRKAIDSALGQTHRDIEVLVWDDGSTDRSHQILQSYRPQIDLLGGHQVGSNAARNALLKASSGEWVQFLDADDYLQEDKIATQLREADIASAEVIFSPVIEETWRGSEKVRQEELEIDSTGDLYSLWLGWRLAQTGSVLWKRSALDSIGGWNTSQPCCQDNEITLRALQANLNIECAPSAKAVYRVWSEETLCRKAPHKVIHERTRLTEIMIQWLQRQSLCNRQHRQIAGQAYLEMARTLARRDLAEAASYLRQRKRQQKITLGGDAAPWSYRAIYRLFGFQRAEQLALILRSRHA